MSEEEYRRLMLLSMVELLRMVDVIAYGSPIKSYGGRAQEVIAEIMMAVEGADNE